MKSVEHTMLMMKRAMRFRGLVQASTLSGSLVLTGMIGLAADWPQYNGLNSDRASAETVAAWPAAGPKVLWKVASPNGFSSFAVSGDTAVTVVKRDVDGVDREVCVGLEAATGKEKWATPVGIAKYDGGGDSGVASNRGGDGPRSTPSVAGGRVFVSNAQLGVTCLDSSSGAVIWTRDLVKENAGRNIGWQNAASPVVDGDRVFVAGGGSGESLLALSTKDGAPIWKVADDKMTHATPVVATILGVRQVVFFTQRGLVGLDVKDGRELWRYDFPYKVSSAASPVVAGDVVYCSAGYGVGAGAARITREGDEFKATELWRVPGDKELANHWSTPLFRDGYLYGMFSFKKYGDGPLKCVDFAKGKVVWEQEGFGAGNVVRAGDKILALSDAGDLVMVAADPTGYRELARAKVLEGKCWTTPVVSGGRVFARSTKEAVCLEVSGTP